MFEYADVLIFFAGFFTGYFLRPSIEPIFKAIVACMTHR